MEIENYRQQPQGSTTVALFDLYFPAAQCRYRNFRIVQGKKGKFVSPPSFKQEFPDGSAKFIPYIEYSPEKGKEFIQKVYDGLKEHGYL